MKYINKQNIMVVGAVLILGTGLFIEHSKPSPQPAPAPIASVAPLDPQMAAFATELGINQTFLLATQPTFGDAVAACHSSDPSIVGCQDFNTHKIVISHTTTSEDRATLAYEYLHYIWEVKLDQSGRELYKPYLLQIYNANPNVQQVFVKLLKVSPAEGGFGGEAFYDELHSLVGAEMADKKLPTILLDHYKQYVPNRTILPSYY